MLSIEPVLLTVSVLLVLAVVASKTSGRLGVPALLVFLIIGMLAGSEGPGGIHFDDPKAAQAVGVIALACILFAGGLDTEWRAVRPQAWRGLSLSTVGVAATTGALGGFLHHALGYTWLEGLLLGAIVSSTDAAAVFAVLRSRNVSLQGGLKPLLELESGSNDPMAVFLTIAAIHLTQEPSASLGDVVRMFGVQMPLGAVLGYGIGKGMVVLVNRIRLEYEGLYPVMTLALVLFAYSAATQIGGNGFLTVYVAGLVMGSGDFIHKRSLVRFHDGLAWLMQITMFVTLGLLVFPSRLLSVTDDGLLMAGFLMLVARPVGVFLSLFFAGMGLKEKAFVAWVGLRGAVPIVLATFPLVAGVPRADHFFNLVFFVVLASVLLQGTSIPSVARWLGLDAPLDQGRALLGTLMTGGLREDLVEMRLPDSSPAAGKQLVDLGCPEGTLVALMRRGGETIVPTGATVLRAGDTVLLVGNREGIDQMRTILGTGW